MKEKQQEIRLKIIVVLILIILSLMFFNYVLNGYYEAGETIERCKEKGWYGAKFKDSFSTEMICVNLTQAEKDALESKEKGK